MTVYKGNVQVLLVLVKQAPPPSSDLPHSLGWTMMSQKTTQHICLRFCPSNTYCVLDGTELISLSLLIVATWQNSLDLDTKVKVTGNIVLALN